jgi:DNA-binding NarL/FixJ family response regulator
MAIRILVVEAHSTVRRAIRALLELVRDFQVVATVESCEEALHRLTTTKPDIVLIDIFRPGATDLKCLVQVRERFPSIKVIVLSLDSHALYVQQTLRAGVSGYLLKNITEELEPAIRAVAAGGTFFSRAITDELAGTTTPKLGHGANLSPRQAEVLKLIARGYSTKEIAERLSISVKTAQTHRTELMQRLDLHDVAGLVRFAIRHGLIRPD